MNTIWVSSWEGKVQFYKQIFDDFNDENLSKDHRMLIICFLSNRIFLIPKRGKFGVVYQATERKTGKKLAAKFILIR